jgi:hypothetical protein
LGCIAISRDFSGFELQEEEERERERGEREENSICLADDGSAFNHVAFVSVALSQEKNKLALILLSLSQSAFFFFSSFVLRSLKFVFDLWPLIHSFRYLTYFLLLTLFFVLHERS